MPTLCFDSGSILVSGNADELHGVLPFLTYDPRVESWRSQAFHYGDIKTILDDTGQVFTDDVGCTAPCPWTIQTDLVLRDYQQEAIDAWEDAGRRGVVVLPTGVGKSIVGVQAIANAGVPSLVVLPTIDLMNQWASQLEKHFGVEVGMLGGGSKEVRDLTVSTYDSASMMMEFLGNRFGLIIFDEVHHLPGKVTRTAAEMSCAPCRLGLTATIEREDQGEEIIFDLLGPEVYRREIDEFEGKNLADYETRRISVNLDQDERDEYEANRAVYRDFLKSHRINFAFKNGWQNFLRHCATAPDGPQAMAAYRRQKEIAAAGRRKLEEIWVLLKRHSGDRIIIFTALNALAYEIGETFLLPVITHHTKAAERKEFLDNFRDGSYNIMVTSRVLNEGIDVPEAGIGVVVSGSGSVREHVQRLGRILRPSKGKQAVLYEIVSADTGETWISERRRQHRAYKRPS